MNRKQIFVASFIIAAIITAIYFDIPAYFTLERLKAEHASFQNLFKENPLIFALGYFVCYVAIAALSIPGAAVLTLAGGAIFGFAIGLLLVSFASTIGATLAFLSARFMLRDAVLRKFGTQIAQLDQGIQKDGAFYLFTLRLIPAFPFFLVNLGLGLTSIKVTTFYWVSQIGMLLGTAVYVNAGTELATLTSVNGILSPSLIGSFIMIGLLPLVTRKIISAYQGKKMLGKWPKPKSFDYNLIVIGAGSGGLVSAYIAAAVKAKVALIEKHKMGGDCLNTGCVPSKALIRSAKALHTSHHAPSLGLTNLKVEFKFSEVMSRIKRVIKAIEPHDSVERYTGLGVECISGDAKILSPYRVQVSGRELTTRSIIIATGGSPVIPNIKGLKDVEHVTSDTLWDLQNLPKNLLVLGGGPIGLELAQAFSRLGTRVTVVEMMPSILPRDDKDVSDAVYKSLTNEGTTILQGYKCEEFQKSENSYIAICTNGRETKHIEFDKVLLALGRKANITGFGAEDLGIAITKDKKIETNSFLATNYPNIFACGDVTGDYQFTHVAAHEAWYASVNALFGRFRKFKADYRVIPMVTFTDPEVARVGINEVEAQKKGIPYETTIYHLDDLDRAIADEEAYGFVKVLTPPKSDKILGATIVGSHAGDMLAEFTLAMRYNLGLNKILGTIHPYPTFAEGNKYAAGVWKKAHAPEGLLKVVQKYHEWARKD